MKTEIQSEKTLGLSKSFGFKWQKRHWLLALGLACLALWWLAPSLKDMPWLQTAIGYLPVIGSLAFATDNLLKLAQ